MKKRRKTLLLIGACFWGMATLHAQTAFDPMLDANDGQTWNIPAGCTVKVVMNGKVHMLKKAGKYYLN